MRQRTLIIALCLCLGACGIKPESLDAPEGAETGFPHTYPAENTDPPPPLKPTTIENIEPMPPGSGPVATY